MLNLGQVVYDYTNERVVVFAGFRMLQNTKTGECHSESGFILEDGTFIHIKGGEKIPFEYSNFNRDGKPFPGTFIKKCQCEGHYFGIVDGDDEEVKTWAQEAIEEMKAVIEEHGLNVTKTDYKGKTYKGFHIGTPVDNSEPKL